MTSTRQRWICRAVLASMLLIVAGAARAQTIVGTVSSSAGGVPDVTVHLLELSRMARTGSSGRFTFTNVPKGTYRIFAAAQGFASVTDTVHVTGDVTAVSITLHESPMRLEDVVVSAAPDAGLAKEQYQSTAT